MRKSLLSFLGICIGLILHAGNLTPGNIVVVRVGTGSSALSNASTQVYLDEYTTSGTLVQSIAAPATVSGSNHALTLSGVATSEGSLALSPNGMYLTLAGYDTTVGYVSVASGITNRTIGMVGSNGVFNTATGFLSGSAFVTGNMRSAVTNDGSEFWAAGSGSSSTGGVWYTPAGSFTNSATQMNTSTTNARVVNIYDGQLYFATASGTTGIYTEGTGLPTAFGTSQSILPGILTSDSVVSPYAFLLLNENAAVPGENVLYVADDDITAPYGGIYKYSLVGGTWVSNGNIPNVNGIRGITGFHVCSGTQLYLTQDSGVYSFFDNSGYNQTISGTYTKIVTPAANTVIRGIAFAPGTVVPTSPVASIGSKSNITCNGSANGSIDITVTGGASPLTYLWNGGDTAHDRSSLAPGNYTVTVTDHYGCTSSVSATLTQPNAISITIDSVTNLPCTGGSSGAIRISVTGGTGAYTYHWTNNATTEDISSLTAGTYKITVTDSAGCTKVDSAIVSQSGNLVVTDSVKPVTCYGLSDGSVMLTVSGGTPGYTFRWSGSADTTINDLNLAAGSYTVTVSDHAGCVLTLPLGVSQPDSLSISFATTDVTCYGQSNGAVTATVSGGTASYTYQWTGVSGATNAVSSLSPGTYTLHVTDHNGCVDSAHASVTQPDSLSLSLVAVNDTSFGGVTGSINLTVTGGTPSYSYLWSNSTTAADLANLPAGTYCVIVTDQHGCQDSTCAAISQPNGINDLSWVSNFTAYAGASDIVVSFTSKEEMNISAELYDLTGQLIYHSPSVFSSYLDLHIADASLSAGCYIVRIATDQGYISRKIVVIK